MQHFFSRTPWRTRQYDIYRPTCAHFRRLYTTKLEQQLVQSIRATGPLTVAQYMQACLSHPTEGYYTKGGVFGPQGDFTTSPEISQVFGEMIGTWFASRYLASGNNVPIRVVELGPGRGTLIDDMLRTFRSFHQLKQTHIHVDLVETSETLRESQKTKLRSPSGQYQDINFTWYNSVSDISQPSTPVFTVVVAHELFDALPIHILERTPHGFTEVLVGSQGPQWVAETGLPTNGSLTKTAPSALNFFRSEVSSPGAQLLASTSKRFRDAPIHGRIEISSDSWKTARALGELVSGEGGGAGLIIDYGDDRFFGNSFRAFRRHKEVDVFDQPGNSDLTANVDFAYLREALAPVAHVLGPLSQREFLLRMGLEVRVKALERNATNPARKTDIVQAAQRLISNVGMGKEYKVMGIEPDYKNEPTEIYPFSLVPSDRKYI